MGCVRHWTLFSNNCALVFFSAMYWVYLAVCWIFPLRKFCLKIYSSAWILRSWSVLSEQIFSPCSYSVNIAFKDTFTAVWWTSTQSLPLKRLSISLLLYWLSLFPLFQLPDGEYNLIYLLGLLFSFSNLDPFWHKRTSSLKFSIALPRYRSLLGPSSLLSFGPRPIY